MQYDVNLNATLDIDDDTYQQLMEEFDGDTDEILQALSEDIEGTEIQGYYGYGFVCTVDKISPLE